MKPTHVAIPLEALDIVKDDEVLHKLLQHPRVCDPELHDATKCRIYSIDQFSFNYREDTYGDPNDLDDKTFEVVSRSGDEEDGDSCGNNWTIPEFIEAFNAGEIKEDWTLRVIKDNKSEDETAKDVLKSLVNFLEDYDLYDKNGKSISVDIQDYINEANAIIEK